MRNLTLEQRVARLERLLRNEGRNHRTYELLGGLVGKVNATEKDRDKVVGLLKQEFDLGDDDVYISSVSKFKFNFTFYSRDELDEALGKLEPSLNPTVAVRYYTLEFEDTEKDKIVVKLSRGASKFELNDSDSLHEVGKNKSEQIDEMKGLSLVGSNKLVTAAKTLLKNNGVSGEVTSIRKGDNLIRDNFYKLRNKRMNAFVDELENDQLLKNVEWSSDKFTIIGMFYLKDAHKENGVYKLKYDLSENYYSLYSVEKGKYIDKGYGNGEPKTVLKNVLVANINQRGKMHPGSDYQE